MKLAPHRPITWPKDIDAPKLALEFYEILSRINADTTGIFDMCHIYTGKSINGTTPVIKSRGKLKGIASIAATSLALPSARRTCGTKNCINPFHHIPEVLNSEVEFIHKPTSRAPEPTVTHAIADLAELLEYTADKEDIKRPSWTFDVFRVLIPSGDMSDSQLHAALEYLRR